MRTCPLCQTNHNRNGAYCRDCHNAYMREWRKSHPLTEAERRKSITRAYTHVLLKRGHLTRKPCRICGLEPAQAHHPDYNDPRRVDWLCPPHHRAEHDRLYDAALTT